MTVWAKHLLHFNGVEGWDIRIALAFAFLSCILHDTYFEHEKIEQIKFAIVTSLSRYN
jgi:hypothetical protein